MALCQTFGCLPSALDGEDGVRLLEMMYAQHVAEAFGKLRWGVRRTGDEEALIKEIMLVDGDG